MALARGGLAYTVEKRAVAPTRAVGPGPVLRHDTAGSFVTIRSDRQTVLGVVGESYHPLQNLDAFAVLQPLLDADILALETGGALRGGADAWLLARVTASQMTQPVQDAFRDEILPYVLFANNHSGRRDAIIAETPIRVVCGNTLTLAEHLIDAHRGRRFSVSHSRGAELRIVEAARTLFAAIVQRYGRLAADFELLRSCRLTETEFDRLVLDPTAPEPDRSLGATAVERALRRRTEVRRLWTEGEGHAGAYTAWEAYNGLVQAVEHDPAFEPDQPGETRVASMLDGDLGKLLTHTLDRLVAHSGARRSSPWGALAGSAVPGG